MISELLLNFDKEAKSGYAVTIVDFHSVYPNDLFVLSNFSPSAFNLHPPSTFLVLLADCIAVRIQEIKQIHSIPASIAIKSRDSSDAFKLVKHKRLRILSLASRYLEYRRWHSIRKVTLHWRDSHISSVCKLDRLEWDARRHLFKECLVWPLKVNLRGFDLFAPGWQPLQGVFELGRWRRWGHLTLYHLLKFTLALLHQ